MAQRIEGLLARILSKLLNRFDAPKIGSRINPLIVGPRYQHIIHSYKPDSQ